MAIQTQTRDRTSPGRPITRRPRVLANSARPARPRAVPPPARWTSLVPLPDPPEVMDPEEAWQLRARLGLLGR
ncbi:MAG TPA: hypothetical protein VK592_02785 [Candidatus Dormibacteraeota bacterium]|nr:hypothetical protein [Candidatus Dormibacteraeota bacterium]